MHGNASARVGPRDDNKLADLQSQVVERDTLVRVEANVGRHARRASGHVVVSGVVVLGRLRAHVRRDEVPTRKTTKYTCDPVARDV